MLNDTRERFNAYCARVASLNGVRDASRQFSIDPVIEQKLESVMVENSDFLQAINVTPVVQQEGEVLGLVSTRTIAGRTNTADNNRRNPTDPSGNKRKRTYNCKETDYDWARSYAAMDAWRHKPDFEILLRNAILEQQSLDRIMIGWYGVDCADETDRDTYPLLQDVNYGWLYKIRTNAATQVMDDGNLTVYDDGTNNEAITAIYVKAGATLYDASLNNAATAEADYSSMDALVLDAKRLIPAYWRGRTDLVVIVGSDLLDDKYFNIAQETGTTATEVEATDRILRSTKQIGGLPAVRVPFFPADAILITTLKNLSIYWQEETRRRMLKEEPEYKRVANYESLNEAFVVEEYELCALVENIVVGAAPARTAAP